MKHNSLSLQLSNIFFKQNKLNWGISLITEILLGLLGILLSWLIQQMVDSAVGTAGAIPMMTLVWLNLVVMALVIGVLGMRRHFLPNFLRKAMLQYKNKVYEKLTQKNLASFTKEETSTYLSALSNDIAAIELNYLGNSFSLVSHILVFFATFALMLYYSPLMTLAAIVLMILPVAASLATGRKVAVHEKRLSDKNESFISQLKDSLTGFSVIKAFQAEKELFRQFENSNQTVENAKRDKRRAEALVLQISATAGITAQLGIFLIGAFLIISRHAVTVGMLMAFVNLMGVLTRPIQELPGLIAKRKAAFTLIRKMGGILSENVDDEGIAVDQHLKSGITIRDLSFGYEEGQKVLDGVSVHINAGESVAVVGASGSGKSTLFQLMMGADRNYEGEIRYDRNELRTINTESLYDLLTLIQQNVFIFNASILDNITLYRPFDPEEIERVVQESGLKQLIDEKGADYLCGENGVHLSGGERQRIAIARSLLRKNSILLVDEATSSLDTETASKITRSILDLTGMTRLVITHRLEPSLLRAYDRILVMKDGRIVEDGAFEQLMQDNGYFFSLYTISQ